MQLVYTVQNLLPGDCRLGVQPVYKDSEPTSRELSARSEAHLYFWTYLQGTVCQGYRQFMQFPNLPTGNCPLGCSFFYTVSKPISRELSTGGAAFYMVSKPSSRELSDGVAACLWFPNLSAGHCRSEVQPVFTISDLPGDCWPGARPFYMGSEPTSGACPVVVQPVNKFSEPTYKVLSTRGAAYLYSFWTYVQGTVRKSAANVCVFKPTSRGLSARGIGFLV